MSTEMKQYDGTAAIEDYIRDRSEPEWLRAIRREAMNRFVADPWPTTEVEEWRRTDISSYDFDDYSFSAVESELSDIELPEDASAIVRFSEGRCTGVAINPELAKQGVIVTSLIEAAGGFAGEEVARVLEKHAAPLMQEGLRRADNRIQTWHYATITHGVFIYLPKGVTVDDPIYIDYHETGDSRLSVPHLVLSAAEQSNAMIVQSMSGDEDGEVLCNEGSDVHISQAADVRFMGIQNLNIDSTSFSFGAGSLQRDGSFQHYICNFGGMLSKSRFDCTLDGPGSLVRLNGLYFPYEDQQMDMRTVQHHRAPHAESRTYYKGAVRDESHSIYQGLIEVAENATQTDAYLTNKNLILNDGARADSIPTLQINTDDVSCSHGSSSGKLEPLHLFYLQARGYSPVEAEETLLMGFFDDIIDKAPERIQGELRDLVSYRVRQAHDEE